MSRNLVDIRDPKTEAKMQEVALPQGYFNGHQNC